MLNLILLFLNAGPLTSISSEPLILPIPSPISAGLFRNPSKLKTISHIYVKNKRDYYNILDNLPKFKKYT